MNRVPDSELTLVPGGTLITATAEELIEGRREAGREAIVAFIDRQDEVTRKHSGLAMMEDRVLAIREFGVEWSAWWSTFNECPDEIRLAWHERKKP